MSTSRQWGGKLGVSYIVTPHLGVAVDIVNRTIYRHALFDLVLSPDHCVLDRGHWAEGWRRS